MIPFAGSVVCLQRRLERWQRRLVRGLPRAVVGAGTGFITINHAPARFSRRYGDFTANVCGRLGADVAHARYRVNDGGWISIRHVEPRVPAPLFTIEMTAEQLRPGHNQLTIEATAASGATDSKAVTFEYDVSPVKLPVVIDWATTDLDVQDGHWERVTRLGKTYVRPKPGTTGYDRIIVVTGSFAGGRRIELDLTYLGTAPGRDRWFLFGVLALWGGRPDRPGVTPRAGWKFSIVSYYSKHLAAGGEFSLKVGDQPYSYVAGYRNFALEREQVCHVTIDAWPEVDSAGRHQRYWQRFTWEAEGQPQREPIVMSDAAGSPLPPGEYAVALIAHESIVEFGPVSVRPLPS